MDFQTGLSIALIAASVLAILGYASWSRIK